MIETQRLILRPFTKDDAADAYEYLHDDFMLIPRTTILQFRSFVKSLECAVRGYIWNSFHL